MYGLLFFLSISDGPFGIMAYVRNKLIGSDFFGVFFYKLFSCPFCLGCWCGAIIYSISPGQLVFGEFIINSFAGGAVGYISSILQNKNMID
jgi:hypothetical protein